MRNFVKIGFLVISAMIFLSAGAAAQTDIIIGQGTSGSMSFLMVSSSETIMSLSGSCSQGNACIQGDAYLGSNAGTYSMWTTGNSPILTLTSTPNVFAVNMNGGAMNFSFGNVSGSFTGLMQLTTLTNTSSPQFIGNITVTGATGIFAALWRAGSVVPLDFTISMVPGNVPIGSGSPSTGTNTVTSATLSSGEILPSSPAPEPASIALIGSGLLALGGVLKRRMKK